MSDLYDRDFHAWANEQAAAETGLAAKAFPDLCPWPAAEIMDEEFWPS